MTMSAAVMITTTAAVSVANASMSSNTPPWAGAARLRQTTQQLSDPAKFKQAVVPLRRQLTLLGRVPSEEHRHQPNFKTSQLLQLPSLALPMIANFVR